MSIRIGGVWRNLSEVHVRIGGAWRRVQEAFVRVGGAWRVWLSARRLLYVNGGSSVHTTDNTGQLIVSQAVYDAASGVWSTTSSMPAGIQVAAVVQAGTLIVVVGGALFQSPVDALSEFTPQTNTWAGPFSGHGIFAQEWDVAKGVGANIHVVTFANHRIYNASTRTSTSASSNHSRAAGATRSGEVYSLSNSVEEYNVGSNVWVSRLAVNPPSVDRYRLIASNDANIQVMWQQAVASTTYSVNSYSPQSNTLTNLGLLVAPADTTLPTLGTTGPSMHTISLGFTNTPTGGMVWNSEIGDWVPEFTHTSFGSHVERQSNFATAGTVRSPDPRGIVFRPNVGTL